MSDNDSKVPLPDLERGEIGECVDGTRLELASLETRDARHEREMIVRAPARGAFRDPLTDLAMVDGIRIVRGGDAVMSECNRLEHARANETEVRGVVVDAERVDRRDGIGRDPGATPTTSGRSPVWSRRCRARTRATDLRPMRPAAARAARLRP